MCRLTGGITGLGGELPGVALTARRGDAVLGATSTGVDGRYRLELPAGVYRVSIEMMGFERLEREVTLEGAGCRQEIDLTLSLARPVTTTPAGDAPAAGGPPGGRAAPARAGGRETLAGLLAGRGAGAGRGGFQTLVVSPEASTELLEAGALTPDIDTPPLLLPPGFASDLTADTFAVTGDAARLDRGALNDRQQALARGDISLAVADLSVAMGAQEGGFAAGLAGGFVGGAVQERLQQALQQAGLSSLDDLVSTFTQAMADRGGAAAGGTVLAALAGRSGRVMATADYTFGGSALDAAPYALRGDRREERPYTRQNFGGTLGGRFRLPGLYANEANRTSFTLTYSGGRGSTLFDQYATVPTPEMRLGDFSASPVPLIDPLTSQPFPGNRIPADRLSPQALALLPYFPDPNLEDGARNYRYITATESVSDSVNLRLSHNFTPPAAGAGGLAALAGLLGGGGRGALQRPRTSVTLTTQVQVRRSDGEQQNVFATLGGTSRSSTIGLPATVNIVRGRNLHNLSVNFSRTSSTTRNQFAGVRPVAAEAGIRGVADDPFAWGLPALSFSSLTGLRDTTPSRRTDRRLSTEYRWTRPMGRHSLQMGGDVRFDRGSSHTETNANGAFIFTGLYTSGHDRPSPGYDFADFLLGLPQQASVQYGPGDVVLSGRSLSLYLMDDWRARPNLTLNLGLRYELLWPYVERRGQLVNLDVAPDWTGAAPVKAGETGPFSGSFPDGLVRTDLNNLAPRIGAAWRAWRGLVVRGGYGVSFNAGTYNAIARQLASQPPFAVSNTQIGALGSMLLMEHALLGGTPDETTNNYGVDRDYVLGRVQNWNADLSRNLTRGWALGGSYTHTRGSSLDIVRAPNRDPGGGLRIDDVQPFTWRTAEGSSVLHSMTVRLDRRQIRGVGGRMQYTLARSRDNAPSIGGGGGAAVVAQNDQDIDAEWGLSNFDQRHRLSVSVNAELPFGPGRPWLYDGGARAALLGNWRASATFSADSGTPLTVRVRGATRDVSQGLNGALRADLTGAPLTVADPTIDQFFHTAAFSVPEPGLYGTSGRNLITGPGSKRLDVQVSRDLRLGGGTRAVSIQLRATNLLNMVNYASVDTWVNSPTFGQVLSVRPLRSAQLNLRFRF